jgi:large subunit ribosomal protein L3
MKFILGTKICMSQVFRVDGTVVPVTKVKAGPCTVTQVKTKEKDGVVAIQLGLGERKSFRVNKAEKGHLQNLPLVKYLRDFRDEENTHLKRGDVFTVKIFNPGDIIQVIGQSKGRGFQGVVKRHGFHGQPKTHGHKDQERMPGSIGAGGVQRVFKGMRMAGRMGNDRVTIKNLEVVQINPDDNEIFIKGAIPGSRGSLVLISTNGGKIELEQPIVNLEAEVVENKDVKTEIVEETKVEEKKEEIKN